MFEREAREYQFSHSLTAIIVRERYSSRISLSSLATLGNTRLILSPTFERTHSYIDVDTNAINTGTIWSAPSKVRYESFGFFEVSVVQNSAWDEIISIERRISETSVKLARWKLASGYHHGSIHGESKSLMQGMGRT